MTLIYPSDHYIHAIRRYKTMSKVLVLCRRVHEAVANGHRNSTGDPDHLDWEPVYDTVFKVLWAKLKHEIASAELKFPDYYDPDTTYKEDVLAFDQACTEFELELRAKMSVLEDAYGF